MNKKDAVSTIMTKNVKTVQDSQDLHEVVRIIRNNHIRHIPVLKGDEVVGIISSSDMNRLTFGGLFDGEDGVDEGVMNMLTIRQVMTNKPKTVKSTALIKDVAHILSGADYHALPVEEDGHIVGIVTTTDLIKYLLEQF